MRTDRKRLPVALRNDTFKRLRVEQILDGEIRKLQTKFSDNTRLPPTGRKFDLVVGFRFEIINQIDSTVFFVRFRFYIHCLRIEMPSLSYFTSRTHQVRFTEQLSRFRTQLPTYNMLIQTVVTIDDNLVDTGLRTFEQTNLQIDGVVQHIALDRNQLEEKVSSVHI